jgi:hypothetical protein
MALRTRTTCASVGGGSFEEGMGRKIEGSSSTFRTGAVIALAFSSGAAITDFAWHKKISIF